jgi:hypothetical protein
MDTLPCHFQPRGPARVHIYLPRRGRYTVSTGGVVQIYMLCAEKIFDFNKNYLPFSQKMLYNELGVLYAAARRRARE